MQGFKAKTLNNIRGRSQIHGSHDSQWRSQGLPGWVSQNEEENE